MKRVKILKNSIVTNMAELPDAEADAWKAQGIAENWWGKPERPEIGSDGLPTGNTLPAEYTIVIEDMAKELAEAAAKKRQAELDEALRKEARDQLPGDIAKIKDPDAKAALQKIAVILSKWI